MEDNEILLEEEYSYLLNEYINNLKSYAVIYKAEETLLKYNENNKYDNEIYKLIDVKEQLEKERHNIFQKMYLLLRNNSYMCEQLLLKLKK